MRQGRESEATEAVFCLLAKTPLHTGVRTECHYLINSLCVYVTFVIFTDCESCTRPIPTNPGSMEPGGYGLTRGTCFVARRLEVVAVAGLLWISWCFRWGGIIRVFLSFDFFFFFERARPAASMRPPCLIYLSTSTGVRTGCHNLFSLGPHTYT